MQQYVSTCQLAEPEQIRSPTHSSPIYGDSEFVNQLRKITYFQPSASYTIPIPSPRPISSLLAEKQFLAELQQQIRFHDLRNQEV